ncbi:hypothetical protein ABGB07_42635 [Micromonosporaceae bacterium B7E4]
MVYAVPARAARTTWSPPARSMEPGSHLDDLADNRDLARRHTPGSTSS